MKGVTLLVLALGLLAPGAAAGGGVPEPAWLDRAGPVGQTGFCRAVGCQLVSVQVNGPDTVGWGNGTRRVYRAGAGWQLELDVRPGGRVSGARLLKPGAARGTRLSPAEQREAALFLQSLTGRRFTAQAVRACMEAGLNAQARDPDVYGPAQPLSRWRTPGGVAFRARCGVAGAGPLGVWAGWQQG
ncbi:hypothetical protein LAJ19_11090 [Deinococcus taeanensis]|uniref:hypothetical protein n=1 Tax=Deinococcus taeanensis TaxID=2737050 RepID=UPI001CDD1CAA|nr:hypothetical protein [Deinococcus taeanensis]UBV42169.1 hypothetical protein LAJ19_11090 [Deinococcus taeanensis]